MTAAATTPRLIAEDGSEVVLDVDRWMRHVDAVEESLLQQVVGPALDIGCGPGRIALALSERGVPCLGVDVSPAVVDLARDRGVVAIQRSIFDRIPGYGRWMTALLFDGNIGIGGDPAYLLQRVMSLIHPRGRVLVELEPQGGTRLLRVKVHCGGAFGMAFPWARVGLDGIVGLAPLAGCIVEEVWREDGRAFASLARTPAA